MNDVDREDLLRDVRDIVILRLGKNHPTHSIVCQQTKSELTELVPDFTSQEFENIVSEIECNIRITVEEPNVVVDRTTQSDWFSLVESKTKLTYYNRYNRFLMREGFAYKTRENIKKSCCKILSLSANPNALCDKKRGLVVGDVQAGKTANYLALINLACDFGYKIIVLLAGMTDSLREQTQGRIDFGFIGAASSTINGDVRYVGVGDEKKDEIFAVPLTNTLQDFSKAIKSNINATSKEFSKPLVLVVKKNKSVLTNVYNWLKKRKNQGKNILIVDDEADNATPNVNKDTNPTEINKAIRKLYAGFDVATYVGFTATPFANIFINPIDDESLNDLFPSDFIVQLNAPSNYCGAHWFFDNAEENNHLRLLDEYEPGFLPAIHKQETQFTGPAESLKEAILVFLLGCCVRTLRGQKTKHRSMLINISRFNILHSDICFKVKDFVDDLCNIIVQETYKPLNKYLEHPLLKKMYNLYAERSMFNKARNEDWFDFEEVRKVARDEIELFNVTTMNNEIPQKDRFSYAKYPNGARVIVVGGLLLSRGLTLEGLMVSYYSRNASAYDSLLQMGRWFGYRPLYDDLCVLYISKININNFKAVIAAVDDLKQQFRTMEIVDKKPRDFGLMVRESPETLETVLLVTNRNKMKHSKSIKLWISFGGTVADTSKIYKLKEVNEKNEKLCHQFFKKLFASGLTFKEVGSRHIISCVPKKTVADFIKKLVVHFENRKFDTTTLSTYIAESEMFQEWDIVVATGSHKEMFWNVGNIKFPATLRSCDVREEEEFIRVGQSNNRLIDPGIFSAGLTEKDIAQLSSQGEKSLTYLDYLNVEGRRPLLVFYPLALTHNDCAINDSPYIGFAVGFPSRDKKEKVAYRINDIKKREYYGKKCEELISDMDIGNENE